MTILIWIGAVLAFLGVAGIVYTAVAALRARRAGLSDAAMRSRMQRLVAVNFAALGIAVFGLMILIVGLFLR